MTTFLLYYLPMMLCLGLSITWLRIVLPGKTTVGVLLVLMFLSSVPGVNMLIAIAAALCLLVIHPFFNKKLF